MGRLCYPDVGILAQRVTTVNMRYFVNANRQEISNVTSAVCLWPGAEAQENVATDRSTLRT